MTSAPLTTAAPDAASRDGALSFADIRRLVTSDFPPLSAQAAPEGMSGLGEALHLRQWLADTQGKDRPSLRHPRLALFLSRHGGGGDIQDGIAALPSVLAAPAHPLSAIAAEINADLQVYELDLATASGDPAQGAALTEEEALQALAYGMMAVQPGIDCIAIALPNPAAAGAAENLQRALAAQQDPLAALLHYGGFDIAAALGAAIAARLARTPVLLDDSAAIVGEMLGAMSAEATLHICPARNVIDHGITAPAAGLRAALALALLKALCKIV
jgi:nicotinate-nucleotide--dimethylbenzimidazole phosphoribosyltransferase